MIKLLLLKMIKKLQLKHLVIPAVRIKKNCPEQEYNLATLNRCSLCPGSSAVLVEPRRFSYTDEKVDLSIIVPVYKVEKYIRQCLQSLLQQNTSYCYQIILINDGTPDGSIERVKDLLQDNRITFLNQENKGFSGARNSGFPYARGRFLTFVDSDDYVSADFVEALLHAAYENQADVVVGGFTYYYERNEKRKEVQCQAGRISNIFMPPGFTWGKIFRKELFQKIEFPEGYWFEDSIMKHLVLPQANQVYGVSDCLYVYRVRTGSISKLAKKSPKCMDSTWITVQMLRDRKKLGLCNDSAYLEYFLFQLVTNYQREQILSRNIKKEIFYWMAHLIRTEFSQADSREIKDADLGKLYQALVHFDFSSYCRLCFWIK